jgi:TRAP-type C4-dicarboxylate transport system permease small subunit
MGLMQRIAATLGKLISVALALLGALAILWAIVYRFVLPFTPPWLDASTCGAAALAVVAGLVVTKRSQRPK